MKNIIPKISATIFVLAVIGWASYVVIAQTGSPNDWRGPTQAPPGGNVDAPINTGPDGQVKKGSLYITGLNATNTPYTNGLIVRNGNVGIGTESPSSKFVVEETNPRYEYVKYIDRFIGSCESGKPSTCTTDEARGLLESTETEARCGCEFDNRANCELGYVDSVRADNILTNPTVCKDNAVKNYPVDFTLVYKYYGMNIIKRQLPTLEVKNAQLKTKEIRISDGSEGMNKILTSDMSGLGRWQTINYFFGLAGNCPNGKYMTGFNADGTIKCASSAPVQVISDVISDWTYIYRDAEACRDHFNGSDTCNGSAFEQYTCSTNDRTAKKSCVDYSQIAGTCQYRYISCR